MSDSHDQLKRYIERIESLESDKQDVADEIKDVYKEAVNDGFDRKGLRTVIKLRKMTKDDREAADAVVETYREALNI